MTRRQRSGRGGKDYNGCGQSLCWCCANARTYLGATRAERAAELELHEVDFSHEVLPDDVNWGPVTRLILTGEVDD